MFKSFAAAAVRQAYNDFNYNEARALVAAYAEAGLASYAPADKHNGGVAQVLIEGEIVGQASRLMVGMDYALTQKIKAA